MSLGDVGLRLEKMEVLAPGRRPQLRPPRRVAPAAMEERAREVDTRHDEVGIDAERGAEIGFGVVEPSAREIHLT
jgi:hypothetical protein